MLPAVASLAGTFMVAATSAVVLLTADRIEVLTFARGSARPLPDGGPCSRLSRPAAVTTWMTANPLACATGVVPSAPRVTVQVEPETLVTAISSVGSSGSMTWNCVGGVALFEADGNPAYPPAMVHDSEVPLTGAVVPPDETVVDVAGLAHSSVVMDTATSRRPGGGSPGGSVQRYGPGGKLHGVAVGHPGDAGGQGALEPSQRRARGVPDLDRGDRGPGARGRPGRSVGRGAHARGVRAERDGYPAGGVTGAVARGRLGTVRGVRPLGGQQPQVQCGRPGRRRAAVDDRVHERGDPVPVGHRGHRQTPAGFGSVTVIGRQGVLPVALAAMPW